MDFLVNKLADSSLQFVFAWVRHPVLGNLIEPFAINCLKSGHFSYEFYRFTGKTIHDYFPDASPAQRSIVALIDKYSEEVLQKKFRATNKKSRTFLEDLTPEFIEDHIRPYIDRLLYQICSLLLENGIPLYYKGEKNERIQEQAITIEPRMAHVLFVFDRQEHETHYSLQMLYHDQPIALNQAETMLLSQKPCLLRVNNNIYRFQPGWDGKKLLPFFSKEFLVIPKSAEKAYFQKFVLKAVRDYQVQASGFSIDYVNEPPAGLLSMETNWKGDLVLQLYFRYAHNFSVHCSDASVNSSTIFHDVEGQYSFTRIARQPAEEKRLIAVLNTLGLINQQSEGFYIADSAASQTPRAEQQDDSVKLWELVEWLGVHQATLCEHGFELDQKTTKGSFHIGIPELKIDIKKKTDWFDLHAVVVFGEFQIPFIRLKHLILQGKREFVLPDGTIGLIPAEWIDRFHDIMRFASGKDQVISLKKHHFPLLEEMVPKGLQPPEASLDLASFTPPGIPAQLNARLRSYQARGYHWLSFLYENKLGGCLADDMGLGKTLQTLALLSHVHLSAEGSSPCFQLDGQAHSHAIQPPYQLDLFLPPPESSSSRGGNASLIVMPLSLVHNWLQEIRRFAPCLRVLQHTGPSRPAWHDEFSNYHLVLTTYGTVRSDVDMLAGYPFKYIILDESQVIKNAGSKIFNAIKALKGQHRLVLTGTPIENSLSDLWSQFSFINPGMLGSQEFFRQEFVLPIERSNNLIRKQKLQKLIAPFILRRTKDQVARELPALTQMTRYCEMTPEQGSLYESRKSQIRNLLLEQVERDGMDRSRFVILGSLMKLRMLANHPLMTEEDYEFDAGKFIVVRNDLSKLVAEGHKVLIFSQFVRHLNIYRDYLQQEGLGYSMLTGKVPESERMVMIRQFQEDPAKQIFLISLRAGGVGLNLTGADYVFMLDPWWNPAVEMQAINRAHRIGQDKKVFVYKYITRQTVEEKILSLQQRKSELAGMFIHSNNPLKDLKPEELKNLID